jgi:hypothetical protein
MGLSQKAIRWGHAQCSASWSARAVPGDQRSTVAERSLEQKFSKSNIRDTICIWMYLDVKYLSIDIYIYLCIYIYLSICIYIYVYIWWNIREICFYLYMEVSIVMGVRNSWMCVFFYWKIILKNGWFRGTPILGNLHVWICDISWYFYIFLSLMFSRLIFGTKTFDRFCSCIWI